MNRSHSTMTSVGLATGLVFCVGACGGPSQRAASLSFPETALTTERGSSGVLNVAVRSSPQPPVRGLTNFQLTVTDADGNAVSGLQLSVVPWMPQMGHGTSVTPVVKDVGDGVYQVTDVYLFMAGLWELRTNIAGAMSDSVAPQFQID